MNRIMKPWIVSASLVIAYMVSACGVAAVPGEEAQDTSDSREVHAMSACTSNSDCLQQFPLGNAPYCCTSNGGASYSCFAHTIPCGDTSECGEHLYCAEIHRCVPDWLSCMAI